MLLLMAVYWCTEAIPLAVTALLPLVLAPLLSIQTADLVARNYLKVRCILNGSILVIYCRITTDKPVQDEPLFLILLGNPI